MLLKKAYLLIISLFLLAGCGALNTQAPVAASSDATAGAPAEPGGAEDNPDEEVIYEDGFLTKIEDLGTFEQEGVKYVYLGRKTCPTCVKWLPILEDVSAGKEVYYFDTDLWRGDEGGQQIVSGYGIKTVPTLLQIENGELVKKLDVTDNFVEEDARAELQAFLNE
ncbi:MAG: thioredoxin family protein [Clostridiales bacterium]|jgi:thiol-disulfide isomerase/thioredoxin|nr:thioredoxin family protein [Clostridiales bacterium]